ncbi:helix-turn-helix domain-containing protein [Cellulosilyticum lentocellum]|uniref:Transposase IS3/IS911 family protein n=1 Tax=Cellulosilyticum lentocellum (strain ATCC 49066 / DSM 5427 / NCIMB 11756 / RHM5) TaxID=642492 RepID=F2JIF0_CELLD|nr:helix-turn-helix domain-containing protein [Cellulosilyticum lentocellum]ADZ84316.1 transposase IS3/IS911 family protein [Cellulosilyticum lentocellum DSM 5427]
MAESPHTPEWRVMVAKEYLDGLASSIDIASKYNITSKTVRRWAQRYMEHGILAFARGIGNTRYTSDFKKMCCKIYLDGEMSTDEITAKYNISCEAVLANWIKMYNANRELSDYVLNGRSIWPSKKKNNY